MDFLVETERVSFLRGKYEINVYCVKDRRITPNVAGTEQVVETKNGRKLLAE